MKPMGRLFVIALCVVFLAELVTFVWMAATTLAFYV
jgi:hypothetical protein